MKHTALILMLALAMLIPLPSHAATSQSSAYAMLSHYATSINQGDYAAAYSDWLRPYQTYEQFVAGYTDTRLVQPYLGHYQPADSISGRIPAVLLGYHLDGTITSYYGCYRVRYTTRWGIDGGSFHPIATTAPNTVPDQATIAAYLQVNCYFLQDTVQDTFTTPDFYSQRAYDAIHTYYDLINAAQYDAAYARWLSPLPGPQPNGGPPSDYRPAYGSFGAGYADTDYISVYVGPYQFGGAAAGKPYLDGFLPVVLISQHTNGAIESYYGCYVMGGLPTGGLGIVNGRLLVLMDDMPTADAIFDALATDCTSLGMPF